MKRSRLVLSLVILSLGLLTPGPAHAAGPMCGASWDEADRPARTCAFTYLGGELFVAGAAIPRFREITPAAPLGPEMKVYADVRTNPLDDNSSVLRCADAPGVMPGGIAFPAACADGRPSLPGVPMGTTLYCLGKGTPHGFFFCVSNNL